MVIRKPLFLPVQYPTPYQGNRTLVYFCRTTLFPTACHSKWSPLLCPKGKHVTQPRLSVHWILKEVKMGEGYNVSSLIWKAILCRDCPYIILATEVPVISETSLSFDSETYPLSFHCIPLKYPKTVCQLPSLTPAFLTPNHKCVSIWFNPMGKKVGVKHLLFGKREVRFCSWMGRGCRTGNPSLHQYSPLHSIQKAQSFAFDRQTPHPQTKRLMILSVQLKIEIVMNP